MTSPRQLPPPPKPAEDEEGRQQGAAGRPRGAWSSVGFWRSFGLLASGVATVLFAAFLYSAGVPRGEPALVAVLIVDVCQTIDVQEVLEQFVELPGRLRQADDEVGVIFESSGRISDSPPNFERP